MNFALVKNFILTNPRHSAMSSTNKMFEKKDHYFEIPYDCVPVEHFFSDLEDVVIAHYENLSSTHS